MNTAMLPSGKVIAATQYNEEAHGTTLYCIDKSCKASLIFVPATENTVPYFKTTGKTSHSKHRESCAFFRPLTFQESIEKVSEFQENYLNGQHALKENLIRLNLNRIDPDYEPKSTEREKKKEVADPNEVKVKQDHSTPKSISSIKAIVKLIKSYEPDILATIIIGSKGNKIPLSQIILSHDKAHELLWNNQAIDAFSYFVYGTIEKVHRRSKVYYINLKPINNVSFSLVVFDKYFKYFTYTDEQLIGKSVLAWGVLRRNTYKDKNTSEMIIKSNQYIEFL